MELQEIKPYLEVQLQNSEDKLILTTLYKSNKPVSIREFEELYKINLGNWSNSRPRIANKLYGYLYGYWSKKIVIDHQPGSTSDNEYKEVVFELTTEGRTVLEDLLK